MSFQCDQSDVLDFTFLLPQKLLTSSKEHLLILALDFHLEQSEIDIYLYFGYITVSLECTTLSTALV
jgi:hypothetical protein